MRYFFHIGYNGFKYRGWQRQTKAVNIQEIVEKALHHVLKMQMPITGCGRTDAQVHASQFFFHVDIIKEWDYDLLFRLNKMLPDEIAIYDIIPMKGEQHARYDASLRTYDYFIHTYKDPFLSTLSSFYLGRNLDLSLMKKAVAVLPNYNDYRGFCKTPANYRTTICNVESAALFTDGSGDRIRFQISANRFLASMIRIIVNKLLEVGRGVLTVNQFESYLISKETPKLIKPAYPQGLYLSKVTYPFLDIPSRTEFSAINLRNQDQWIAV